MAVFEKRFQLFLLTLIDGDRGKNNKNTWQYDPILSLLMPEVTLYNGISFRIKDKEAADVTAKQDPVYAFKMVIGPARIDIPIDVERRLVALKLGFPHLPATTATTILKGFGENIEYEETLKVFASYGLSNLMRRFSVDRDFFEINRRAAGWFLAIENPDDDAAMKIRMRYQGIKDWLQASKGKKSEVFKRIPMKRALFFHWWNNFQRLGLLGLADPGPELFRRSKIGPDMEAKIVIDRLQYPERKDSSYVERLATQRVNIKRNAISKVFDRWKINKWNSAFKSNLFRFESDEPEDYEPDIIQSDHQAKLVEQKFLEMIKGMEFHPVPLSVPGLPMLWVYIEELGLLPVLNQLQLSTTSGREYYSSDISKRRFRISL